MAVPHLSSHPLGCIVFRMCGHFRARTHRFRDMGFRFFPMHFRGGNFDLKIEPPASHVAPGRKCYGACTASRGHQLHRLDEISEDQSKWLRLVSAKNWSQKLQEKKQFHG